MDRLWILINVKGQFMVCMQFEKSEDCERYWKRKNLQALSSKAIKLERTKLRIDFLFSDLVTAQDAIDFGLLHCEAYRLKQERINKKVQKILNKKKL